MVRFNEKKNLFTQVHIDEALRGTEEKLAGDQSLIERTRIPAPQLLELVELCLRSSYFQFQDSILEQVDGTAMGSPLSPVIANLYMVSLDRRHHSNQTCGFAMCMTPS